MKIHAHILAWNEEKILPYTLDHYSEFCEKIRNEYKGPKPLRFHIYSLGKEDDFSFLKG